MSQSNQYTSHKLFFSLSTYEKLNEFLKRADKSTKVLETHINDRLTDGLFCKVKITNKCDMIIIDYYNPNNILIGHVTFHLEPEKKLPNGSANIFGRMHIQSNQNTQLKYVLQLNKIKYVNKNNSFRFSIKHTHIKQHLKPFIDATLHVLNEYFDLSSSLLIDKRLANNYPTHWHSCFDPIKKKFNISERAKKNTLRRKTHKKK